MGHDWQVFLDVQEVEQYLELARRDLLGLLFFQLFSGQPVGLDGILVRDLLVVEVLHVLVDFFSVLETNDRDLDQLVVGKPGGLGVEGVEVLREVGLLPQLPHVVVLELPVVLLLAHLHKWQT